MRRIYEIQWQAKRLLTTALMLQVASQIDYLNQEQQESLDKICDELAIYENKIIDIIHKTPNPDLITDAAVEDLENFLSKKESDLYFDLGINIDEGLEEIIAKVNKKGGTANVD